MVRLGSAEWGQVGECMDFDIVHNVIFVPCPKKGDMGALRGKTRSGYVSIIFHWRY